MRILALNGANISGRVPARHSGRARPQEQDRAGTPAGRRRIRGRTSTVVSAAILIGAEVFGAAFAGGWAIANLLGSISSARDICDGAVRAAAWR